MLEASAVRTDVRWLHLCVNLGWAPSQGRPKHNKTISSPLGPEVTRRHTCVDNNNNTHITMCMYI